MRILLFSAVVIIISIVLQMAVINNYVLGSFIFPAPLIFIIYLNWLKPTFHSLLLTIIIGWGISYISILPFGVDLLYLTVTALIIQYLTLNKFILQTYSSLLITVIGGLAVYDFIIWILIKSQYFVYLISWHTWFVPYHFVIQFFIAGLFISIIHILISKHEIRQSSIAI